MNNVKLKRLTTLLLSTTVLVSPISYADKGQTASSSPSFAADFHPGLNFGGFGGGKCQATKTPVIFIHGAATTSSNWLVKPTGPNLAPNATSVYQTFKDNGYNDCELFAVTYTSHEEQVYPEKNQQQVEKYNLLYDFIRRVRQYSNKSQVDIVAYSQGVSLALATFEYKSAWGYVRRFVNIAGPMRGLPACKGVGPADDKFPICHAQSLENAFVFGLFPSEDSWNGYNEWTSDSGQKSLRAMPKHEPQVQFYTIDAGNQDATLCPSVDKHDCALNATFTNSKNVLAQLNIGEGSKATQSAITQNKEGSQSLGGDKDGVGHYRVMTNAGSIVLNMLTSECQGADCAKGYHGSVVDQTKISTP